MAIHEINCAAVRCMKALALNNSFHYHRAIASRGRDFSTTAGRPLSGHRTNVEKLWREFFSDPSQWWDSRFEKENARFPDFKHKKTHESLWLTGKLNPPWVEAELATMVPGTVQVDIFTWNKKLARYVKAGLYEKTIELFQEMQREGMTPDKFTFVRVLNACSSLRALEEGRRIHTLVTESRCDSDVFVGNSLVDMYAKCGSMKDAWKVFNMMPTRDVISWNAIIRGCVKCGQAQKALELFQQMHATGVESDRVTFVGVLNACVSIAALEHGKFVHDQIIQRGFESDMFVTSALVDMYAKCGSIDDAWIVFNKMPTHDVVSWNAMILGYVKCSQGKKALELFHQMYLGGVEADHVTFIGALNACASVTALEEGRRVHEQIIQRGYDSDVFVGTSIVDMYAKCGSMEDALRVFKNMPTRNVVSYNAMMVGHVKSGQGQKALELFEQMQREGLDPDPVTFVGALNACASVPAVEEGRRVHELIIQRGYESDLFVGTSIVDMYAKCGSIEDAWRVFKKMPTRNVVSWNAMILGHVKCGQAREALELFLQMQGEGADPDQVTFMGVLNACASLTALEQGRCVHEQIMERNLESDVIVGSCLVNMYAKCGSIEDAQIVFDKLPVHDVVSWTAMILGHVKFGQGYRALELFQQMQLQGVDPDSVTFVGVLNACASLGALEEGRHVHEQIVQRGFESDVFVGTSIVDMYAKCESIEDASRVFKNMPTRNVVSWNAMIMGYVKCGQGHKAMELFRQMQLDGMSPDSLTFMGALNACASIAALEEGRCVHAQIIQSDCESDIFVSNSLVDMYVKGGSIEDGLKMFNKMVTRNLVSWNAMLGGYAMHGYGMAALGHFEQMYQEGVEIDEVTFISLLSACSHSGLVDEGLHYFQSMTDVWGISPTMEHYACVIDVLGRAGRLHEAEDMIKTMSCEPSPHVWMCLLGACRVYGSVEMGERIAQEVLELDPESAGGYVLLSNIYSAAGKWGISATVRGQRLARHVKKEPGCTWIEVNHKMHSFAVDDQVHPQIVEIREVLKELSEQMKEAGYVPDTSLSLW